MARGARPGRLPFLSHVGALAGTVVALALCAPVASAQPAQVFTIAGVASAGAGVPPLCDGGWLCDKTRPWPAEWTATARRFAGECLAHLSDGSLLVCSDGRVVRVGIDGRASALSAAGVTFGDADSGVFASTVAVGADGRIVVGGEGGLASVAPDGTARPLATEDDDNSYSDGNDVLADGSVLVAERYDGRVVQRGPWNARERGRLCRRAPGRHRRPRRRAGSAHRRRRP